MKRTTLVCIVGAATAVGGGAVATGVGAQPRVEAATAVMRVPTGGAVGRVIVVTLPDGTTGIRAVVRRGALPPGFHGFHVHARAACNAQGSTPYSAALGHFNPTNATHGRHAGDLPSLYVTRSNRAVLDVATDAFTVDDLMDADGSAFIIHAAGDNQALIPERYRAEDGRGPDEATLATGDGGARISCGAVRRVSARR
jgi:Cu-Zn family superoxide dismutase